MGFAGGAQPAPPLAHGRGRVRLFAAVEAPEGHRLSIEKAIQSLRLRLPDARWVPREMWHCTLKFLGEVGEERLPEVADIIGESASRALAPETRLTEIGSFPNMRRARVLWIGLEDPGDALAHLAARLEKKFGKAGFRQESRRLHPHLTLARFREPRPIAEAVEECGPYEVDRAPFSIEEVVLFRSRLSPGGAAYEALRRFRLGPSGG